MRRRANSTAHPFLSDAWFEAVETLRERAPAPPGEAAGLAVNMVVTGGPDGDRVLHFAGGRFDRGRCPDAPTTVTVPYRVARSMLVDLDPAAAVTAFMTGDIRIDGDIGGLLALQESAGAMLAPSIEQLAFVGELRALTA